MELIFNELSFFPLAKNIHQAEDRFRTMLNTFKKANIRFGFKKIRFQNNLSNQPITEEANFVQVVSSFTNTTLKNAVLTFLAPPYFDDLTEDETEEFLKSEYKIVSEGCPIEIEPFGMPVAYIKTAPCISIQSHIFWESRVFELKRINVDDEVSFQVANICLELDINSNEMTEWSEVSLSKKILSKKELVQFLGYKKYALIIQDDFFKQLMDWKQKELKVYSYILSLMKDVELHPYSGGMGKTENLKNRGKEASKRITNRYPAGDRLSYIIEENIVTYIACKGHYQFH